MKPNFTLSLSLNGICLTHLSDGEQEIVGTVSLDSKFLASELANLRETAQGVSTDTIATRLIVPNDQIRYLSTDPHGASETDLTEIARQTLTGATPYAIYDLAYDYCIDAGVLRIAAVARETLLEAENFAIEHGFNPVEFGAEPDSNDFRGSPNFGPTRQAMQLGKDTGETKVKQSAPEKVEVIEFHSARVSVSNDKSEVVKDVATSQHAALDVSDSKSSPSASMEVKPTLTSPRADIPTATPTIAESLQPAVRRKPRNIALITAGIVGLVLVNLAIWPPLFSDDDQVEQIVQTETHDIAALPDEYTGDTSPVDIDPPRQSIVRPQELTSDEARVRYAATGVWQKAPLPPRSPELSGLEDFYQTSLDPKVISSDAVALPAAAYLQTDLHPDSSTLSSGTGITFEFDDRGLVIASDYGTLSPQGVIVYSGRPTANQPAWPKRHIVGQPKEIDAPFAGLRLANLRPRARPDDLSDGVERNTLNGRTLSELAAFRPKLRPKAVEERAIATISPGANPETIDTAVAAAIQSSAPDLTPTEEAVTASIMPKLRPQNLEKAARSQKATAAAQPVSTAQKVTPRLPTSASVTRQATQTNAIKLRQVNLIGVYGTPSKRRALVRLANGKYRKVTVGDRLDGGKVSAIGKSDLRYVKKGRNIVLEMPKG
ncbi:hypothetical protein [Roseovarius sp. EL26]|uniref:hypothetical protein n=1 Tax=Roseovarius sp. EL26 TaxID=2126672 RepID=UPI000EA3ACF1|nr:hypothetical protein [Roseovarius sp. EL26]